MKHQSFSSRKSAQKQFVLLLTLTLCLILILNLLLYNHRAQQLYTEQLKKDNYNTALQISREFDASMDLMRTACWNMVHNNREFIRIVETYDNSFEHKTALMSYLSSMLPVNEYFDSVYLYLPNYQTVLSTAMGAMPFDRFFDPVPINDMLSQDKRTSLRTLYSRSTPHVLGGQNISSIVMKVTSPELSRRSWYANTVYPAVNSCPCSTVRARVSGEREHCPHPVRVLSSSIRRS